MGRVLYFAYGSNMLQPRLAASARAPSAVRLAVAEMHRHRLTFDKLGADGSGKCNALATDDPSDRVHGVVYELAVAELPALDLAEGGYARTRVNVRVDSSDVSVETYRALCVRTASLKPFDWYHALVVEGARRAPLPAAYLRHLIAQPSIPDADAARSARAFALVGTPGDRGLSSM